jgi:hypothetical protein
VTKANSAKSAVAIHPLATLESLDAELRSQYQLGAFQKEAAQIKIERFANHKARKNKDFKLLRGYTSERLFELRWNFDGHSRPLQLRLIGAICENSEILLLAWHLKDPALSLEDQRQLQNAACEIAIERKRQIDPDCLST